jgi:hypothetical protein
MDKIQKIMLYKYADQHVCQNNKDFKDVKIN